MTHILAFLFVTAIVSVVFALLMKDQMKERVIFGLKMFGGMILFGLVAGWISNLIT